MREILFKAKRINDGKWVEGYYIYHIKRTICPFNDKVNPEDEQHVIMCDGFSDWNMPRDTVHYDIDPKTLCQFTGLCDKAGNKIWENDIIHYHGTDNDICAIKYGEYDNNSQSRHPGCHNACERYISEKKKHKDISENIRKQKMFESDITAFCVDSYLKSVRRKHYER